jgi:hypothetical protein
MQLALLPLLLAPLVQAPSEAPPLQHLVQVELREEGPGLPRLAALGIDLSHSHAGDAAEVGGALRTLELVVSSEELRLLRAAGFDAEVRIEDLAAHYAARLAQAAPAGAPAHGAWLNPPFASGSMGGYYTWSELVSVMDQLRAAHPTLVSQRVSLGQSHEGRDLWMFRISDNPSVDEPEPEVRFDALHHAREPEGMQTALYFACWLVEEYGTDPLATYLVNEREMYFVLCVNPDGYEYNRQTSPGGGGLWRKNRRNNGGGVYGVDLNRNYPFAWGFDDQGSSGSTSSETYRGASAASEPEVQAMVSFLASREFGTALSIHTYGSWWLAPRGYTSGGPANEAEYDEVGALATEFNGMPYGPASDLLYLANGTTLDHDHATHGTLAWSPELGNSGDGFWPVQARIEPIAEENRLGLARTALAAGSYPRLESVDAVELSGDGDGAFEGGEELELLVSLRNSGRLPASSIEVELVQVDPRLEATLPLAQAGPVAPFSSAALASGPRLRILPGTAQGSYGYTLEVRSGGWSQEVAGEVLVGQQQVVASFDFEAAGDEGWTVGAPDDATTGNWVRLDPIGTQAQPEDDHTTGAGNTRCWFTGQGSVGGSVGEADVDGGTTSLLSPVFDLAGAAGARLSYWRWYDNASGASPGADVFEVDLSNDGGASWVPAEVVGPTGPGTTGGWAQVELELGTLLPLTDQVRLRFRASDLGAGSIVEAALDDLTITVPSAGDCAAPTRYCTAMPGSGGLPARIDWAGSTGIGDDDLTLLADSLPPGGFGLFFHGAGPASTPLGDGLLCVATPIQRLGVTQADATGAASRVLPLTGAFTAGTTRCFQYWYRDVAGGPAGFNFSDALLVTFCD